jgi:hypothetical protein
MTSCRPGCTTDVLYHVLPTSQKTAKTAPRIAKENGFYPSAILNTIQLLEKQLANPNRTDRVGTIRWEPPIAGSDLQRVWLDKGDGATCPPADDPQPDEPQGEEEETEIEEEVAETTQPSCPDLTHSPPPIPGTGQKSSYGTPPPAEGEDVLEPEPEDPAPASPQLPQKTTRSPPPSPPCWQEVVAALPDSEEEAITFEDIAAKFPGLEPEGACHRIKHARKSGVPVRSKTIPGSRFAYHWLDGPAPEIPPSDRACRRSPRRRSSSPLPATATPAPVKMAVESQIKEWIRAGLIVSADVRMMEDGIETRLKYPAEAA